VGVDDAGELLDAAGLAGLLADPIKLRALAAMVLGAATATEVAAATGLALRDAGKAVARLAAAGLLVPEGKGYAVDHERLSDIARTAIAERPAPNDSVDPADARSGVLRRFFRNGRLTSIPASRGKRLPILDFLAGHFEPGRTYPERDVNEILGQFHEDTAALRRYLVDEEFLERREGFYWRAGGTFDIE